MNLNYPKGIIKIKQCVSPNKDFSKARLGMDFEKMLNNTNKFYIEKGICVVHKKPTPVNVVKVNYPKRNKVKIIEAFYSIPSTTDYNGVYNGRYIDFEAKTCHSQLFSFKNIYKHQVEHLKRIFDHGGISFLIVFFYKYNEIYIIDGEKLYDLYNNKLNDRKSISYEFFKKNCYKVKLSNIINYIEYVKLIA